MKRLIPLALLALLAGAHTALLAQLNVGIGTAAPAQRLHTAGGIRADGLAAVGNALVRTNNLGSLSRLAFTGNPAEYLLGNGTFGTLPPPANSWRLAGNAGTNIATNYLGTPDATDLVVRTANTERLRVMAGGNVGIGTPAPNALLHLADAFDPAQPNLGIGNDAAFSDPDVDDGLRLMGFQDPNEAHLLLGSSARYISGGNGGIRIGGSPALPIAQLQLADDFAPGGWNLAIGDQAVVTDIDVESAIGIYGAQNADRAYLRLGSTGGWLSGLGGGTGIANFSTFNPSAQLDLADIYTPGGINLLVGDQLFLSDVDVNNAISLRGMQNDSRAVVQLGESGPYWIGANGGMGIAAAPTFVPQGLLHLADDFSPRYPNLLIGDAAYWSDVDIDDAMGLFGWEDPTRAALCLGSTALYVVGANDRVGISNSASFVPQGQLHLDDLYNPGGRNLLVGDQAYLSDVDLNNTLALVGNQNTDRVYVRVGSTGPVVSGLAGALTVSGSPNLGSAQLQVWDDYAAGGRNLLVGDAAFFSDVDVNNSFSLRGYHDPTRVAVQLGEGNVYLIGALAGGGARVGVHTSASFTPQALLHLGQVLPPHSRYLLVGNDAYLTVLAGPDTLGIFGNQDSTLVNIQMASTGPTLYAENGCLGIGLPNPQYALDLPNLATALGQGRANAWVVYSSGRWKRNIAPIANGLALIRQLQGVTYEWKPGYGTGRDYGFIAEEVGALLPNLVTWDATHTHAQGLDYRRLVPLVTAAAQEQQRQLDLEQHALSELAKRIQNLEMRLR